MRIALNGWFLIHDAYTGSGQYLRALLKYLPRVAPQHEYHVVAPVSPTETMPILTGAVLHPIKCGASNLDKVRFEQMLFPAACRRLKADVAHVPYWAPPLVSPAPIVVTVHDLIPRLLPEYRGDRRVQLYTALVSAAAQGASLILADSDSSKSDIVRELKVPAEKIRTVYLAVEDRYSPNGDWQVDEPIRKKYGLEPEGGYVLYFGGFDIRKNVRGLLSAWTWAAGSIGQGYPLVIGGQLPKPDGAFFEDFPALAQELNVADSVKFIGPVDEADKPALYRGASVFVYPSRYEGFGLPPLEAMACGAPVVVSSTSSLPEVVGNAGYLIPPDDTRALGAALLTCVVEPTVADDLRARGLAQAKKFSWDKTARETAAAYEAVSAGK
jgi:glycosyltransferase involved in cell wall biosynthesis